MKLQTCEFPGRRDCGYNPMAARIMFGGFGGAGFPNNLIQALSKKGVKNITAISNNAARAKVSLV